MTFLEIVVTEEYIEWSESTGEFMQRRCGSHHSFLGGDILS